MAKKKYRSKKTMKRSKKMLKRSKKKMKRSKKTMKRSKKTMKRPKKTMKRPKKTARKSKHKSKRIQRKKHSKKKINNLIGGGFFFNRRKKELTTVKQHRADWRNSFWEEKAKSHKLEDVNRKLEDVNRKLNVENRSLKEVNRELNVENRSQEEKIKSLELKVDRYHHLYHRLHTELDDCIQKRDNEQIAKENRDKERMKKRAEKEAKKSAQLKSEAEQVVDGPPVKDNSAASDMERMKREEEQKASGDRKQATSDLSLSQQQQVMDSIREAEQAVVDDPPVPDNSDAPSGSRAETPIDSDKEVKLNEARGRDDGAEAAAETAQELTGDLQYGVVDGTGKGPLPELKKAWYINDNIITDNQNIFKYNHGKVNHKYNF